MNREELKLEIAFLVKCAKSYYTNNVSLISDEEFDRREEIVNKYLNNDERKTLFHHLHMVKNASSWNKRKHNIKMGSLNKISINTDETIDSFITSMDKSYKIKKYIAEEKLDGISLSLEYINGKFNCAITRGDGEEGEDISINAINFKNVYPTLTHKDGSPFNGSLRCEVIIKTEDFEEVKKYSNKYTTLRGSASGIARGTDNIYTKYLSVIYYDIVIPNKTFSSEIEKINMIESLNIPVVPYRIIDKDFINTIYNIKKEYEDTIRDSISYIIDGIVIKVDDLTINIPEKTNNIGNQVAIKFNAEYAHCPVLDMVWTYGKSGRITPVMYINTTKIGGVNVNKCTLDNINKFNKFNVGIGDIVKIIRSGDVIPYMTEVIKRSNSPRLKVIDKCPHCNSDLYNNNAYLYCSNNDCEGKGLGKIINWMLKMEYKNIASGIITKLYKLGYTDIISFFDIDISDIATIPGFGVSSASKLIKNISAIKEAPLYKIIGSLNIPNVSRSRAKSLFDAIEVNSLDDLFKITVDDIIKVDGFGLAIADNFVTGINEDKELIINISKYIKIIYNNPVANGKLANKTFCFTGSGKNPRNVLQRMVEEKGGSNVSSVSSKTSYLVLCNPAEAGTTKHKSAIKHNVNVISESDFLKIIEEC